MLPQNLDHLFGPQYVTFTSAITEACCLQNGPGIPSGGLWVLEPSIKLGLKIWELMVLGQPRWKDGQPLLGPDGKQEREFWRLGDMHIVSASDRQQQSRRDVIIMPPC